MSSLPIKLRRSLVWANGNNFDKIKAVIESDADAVVLDLEDLCPAPEKDAARAGAVKVFTEWDFKGKERIVRPNPLDTELGQKDIEALLPSVPDAIRLPKCETPEYVLTLDNRLSEFERRNGLPQNRIEIILMLETPLGIINGYQMASCCERVTGMGIGAGDLTNAMGVPRDLTPGSLQLLYAKQKMVMDAKAARVQVFDTTVICQPDKMDAMNAFIEEDTKVIKMMGFTGRSVSMLPHIDIVNRVFAPTHEEETLARKIVRGYEEGLAAGLSEVFVDGNFVDPPIVENAEKVVALADCIAAKAGK